MEAMQTILKTALQNGGHSDLIFKVPKTDDEKQQYSQMKCDSYNETIGDLNLTDGYDCPICKNKGFIAKPYKTEFGYWCEMNYHCKCQKIRATIRRLNKSGLKNIINDYTFAKYEDKEPWQKAIKETAIKFCKDEQGSWFFIGGASGAGKTHICTAICCYYLKKEKQVKYMLWRDDIVQLKANVTNPEEYSKMMQELKTAEVLYIDDLFKTGKDGEGKVQRPTAADVNLAFELLNYRYNNPDLITIISSECRSTDLLDIDEAVGGRVIEKTRGYAINIKPDRSKNYRLKDSIEL